jgi:hypothetical protein
MAKRAKELDNRHEGDRRSCPICNPRRDRVPAWKVWAWSLKHPGQSPWRAKS